MNKNSQKDKKNKLKIILIEQLGGKCVDCGQMPHIVAMDFDHVDLNKKQYNISTLINRAIHGEEKWIFLLDKEIKNTVLRCANCHRIKTFINQDIIKARKNHNGGRKKFLFQ